MSEQYEVAEFAAALTAWRFQSLYGRYKHMQNRLAHRIVGGHEFAVWELRRALMRIALFGTAQEIVS